jgi:hypothetical protein
VEIGIAVGLVEVISPLGGAFTAGLGAEGLGATDTACTVGFCVGALSTSFLPVQLTISRATKLKPLIPWSVFIATSPSYLYSE